MYAMEYESNQIREKAFEEIFPSRTRKSDVTDMVGLQRMMELIKLTEVRVSSRKSNDNKGVRRNSGCNGSDTQECF